MALAQSLQAIARRSPLGALQAAARPLRPPESPGRPPPTARAAVCADARASAVATASAPPAEVEDLAASIVPCSGAAPVAVRAPPGHGPLLVLPGFGNESNDYAAPFGMEDASLLAALRRRGFAAEVLAVEQKCCSRTVQLFT